MIPGVAGGNEGRRVPTNGSELVGSGREMMQLLDELVEVVIRN
jgi:hypothetical protein